MSGQRIVNFPREMRPGGRYWPPIEAALQQSRVTWERSNEEPWMAPGNRTDGCGRYRQCRESVFRQSLYQRRSGARQDCFRFPLRLLPSVQHDGKKAWQFQERIAGYEPAV